MYDLHNFILTRSERDAQYLPQFGIKGVSVIFENNFDFAAFKKLRERYPEFDLVSAIEVTAERKGEVKKAIDKFRNNVDLIIVNAKDNNAMRAASERGEVDFISHAFVDQTSARGCAENNVGLAFDVVDFLEAFGIRRATLISKLHFNLELARKYKIPILLTTGAQNVFGLRNPTQIVALAEAFGFRHEEAVKAVMQTPLEIVKANRDKKQGIEIGEGVRLVK